MVEPMACDGVFTPKLPRLDGNVPTFYGTNIISRSSNITRVLSGRALYGFVFALVGKKNPRYLPNDRENPSPFFEKRGRPFRATRSRESQLNSGTKGLVLKSVQLHPGLDGN
jgi:hypothetical protein